MREPGCWPGSFAIRVKVMHRLASWKRVLGSSSERRDVLLGRVPGGSGIQRDWVWESADFLVY